MLKQHRLWGGGEVHVHDREFTLIQLSADRSVLGWFY